MEENSLVPAAYCKTKAYLEAVSVAKGLISSSRFNVFQNAPIICKGESCEFYNTCVLKSMNMKDLFGTRCPYELAMAAQQSDIYIKHFIPDFSEDGDPDPVILNLIKEVVDYDIQIDRADRIMAERGSFLDDFVVGISVNGEVISNKDVAKWVTYKNSVLAQKHKTLQLLNSTPKDHAATATATTDFASYLKGLKEKAKTQMQMDNAIEVEPIETTTVIEQE